MKRGFLIFMLVMLFVTACYFTAFGEDKETTLIINGEITKEAKSIEDNELIDIKEIISVDNIYNKLLDYSNGYSINYPNDMWVDVSLSPVKTVIADNNTQIEIYYDNLKGTVHYPTGYLYYNNLFLTNDNDHLLEEKRILNINGYRVQLLKWYREKLPRIREDKNYYVSGEFVTSSHEIYMVFIKSTSPINNYMDILTSFKTIPKKGKAFITKEFNKIDNKEFNQETQKFYDKYFIDNEGINWGIFYPSAPRELDDLKILEEKLDFKFDILIRYHTLDTKVPIEELQRAYDDGRYVELTLQTMKMNQNNDGILYEILMGKYDDYLHDYAKSLKDFGHPVLFRLNNEMNGDWCVYSSFHHSKDTDIYIKTWRYIYDIFKDNNVDNIIWVWNPNDISYPSFNWNHYLNYYPGDEYIDVVGMTGYNTGTYYPGEIWRSFNEIYDPLYKEYLSYFKHPLIITEFGSNSIGGSKEEWIRDMFKEIKNYPKIKIAIWFSGIDIDAFGNPARIYQMDEDESYIGTFREGFDLYKDNQVGPLN